MSIDLTPTDHEPDALYLLAKRGTHGTVYYPAADAGIAGWADRPSDACHYASRELAEQEIVNLRNSRAVHIDDLHVVPDPLPRHERFRLAFQRIEHRGRYQ